MVALSGGHVGSSRRRSLGMPPVYRRRIPATMGCCHQFCRAALGRVGYLRPGWFSAQALSSAESASGKGNPVKLTRWIRPAVFATAVVAIAGVMTVLACGPLSVLAQQSAGSGSASESAFMPAPEAPFVLQNSGDVGKVTPTPTFGPGCERAVNFMTEEWKSFVRNLVRRTLTTTCDGSTTGTWRRRWPGKPTGSRPKQP